MKTINQPSIYLLLIAILASCNGVTPTPELTEKIAPAIPSTQIRTIKTATPIVVNTPSLTSTQPATTCLPESDSFPPPEELENYIGWQYNYHKPIPGYWGGQLITKDEQDYGLRVLALDDKSFVLVFEKFLCRDEAGNTAWEILDILQTRPLKIGEREDMPFCNVDGKITYEYPFAFIAENGDGRVYQIWKINWTYKIIVPVSTEGLSCFIDGEP